MVYGNVGCDDSAIQEISVQVVRQPARRCIIDSQAQQDSREPYVSVSLGREERKRAAAYSCAYFEAFLALDFPLC